MAPLFLEALPGRTPCSSFPVPFSGALFRCPFPVFLSLPPPAMAGSSAAAREAPEAGPTGAHGAGIPLLAVPMVHIEIRRIFIGPACSSTCERGGCLLWMDSCMRATGGCQLPTESTLCLIALILASTKVQELQWLLHKRHASISAPRCCTGSADFAWVRFAFRIMNRLHTTPATFIALAMR